MKLKKGKGLFTTICTIITLMFTLFFSLGLLTWNFLTPLESGGVFGIAIFTIVSICATIYLYWHGFKIIFGIDRNTWLYVFVSFFFAAILGGILMFIAKVFD